MGSYLHIARWNNLLFLATTQWLMQYAVVRPLLQTFGFENGSGHVLFWLLMLSTILITAGGYVINDYFDVKIDKLNRPERIIVGEKISLRNTMIFYQVLTYAGTLLGLFIAFFSHSFSLGLIFVFAPGLLWFYSASYKRQFVIGNIQVSFMSALAVFVVGMLAIAQLKQHYGVFLLQTPVSEVIYAWTGGFAIFAFLLTWIREIIKDMEDINGDRELECRTMPIKWGQSRTKLFIYGLIILTILLLLYVNSYYIEFGNNITLRYIIVGLCLPFAVLAYLLFRAEKPIEFHHASTLSKYIMMIGVLYSLVFYYQLAAKFGISLFGLFLVKH